MTEATQELTKREQLIESLEHEARAAEAMMQEQLKQAEVTAHAAQQEHAQQVGMHAVV